MGWLVGLVAVVLIFGISYVDDILAHRRKQLKLKHEMLKDQLELERLKHENYLLETEKLRLELEKLQALEAKEEKKFFRTDNNLLP